MTTYELYQQFAFNHEKAFCDMKVYGLMGLQLEEIRNIMLVLFAEPTLSADNMRDFAQKLELILRDVGVIHE